ncbi:MAG: ASCH domain-containing protein [Chloroflexota bacterium]
MKEQQPTADTPSAIHAFWLAYLESLPTDSPEWDEEYFAEAFGDSPEMTEQLASLILEGTKTATCSALWDYEADDEPLPLVGEKCILLDGKDAPVCIIEITEVEIRPFNQVDARFASDEGEGDRSLGFWRRVHWDFFSRTLAQIGQEPAEDMPLVCERFRVIYP